MKKTIGVKGYKTTNISWILISSTDDSTINQKYYKSYHPENVTVWCDLCSAGSIGQLSYKDAVYRNLTGNGEHYRQLISFFVAQNTIAFITCTFNIPHRTRNKGFIEKRSGQSRLLFVWRAQLFSKKNPIYSKLSVS